MFTSILSEEERGKFLELIYKMACCDGEYAEEEQELLDNYKKELMIDTIPETDSINGLADYFSTKSNCIKRIVLFEVWGMILADRNVGKAEKAAFEYIKKAFDLEDSVIEKVVSVANELQRAYDHVYDVLFTE